MAALVLFLLGVHGAQAFWSRRRSVGPFHLTPTSLHTDDFVFYWDIPDLPSHLRKTWEYTGVVNKVLSVYFEPSFTFSGYVSTLEALTLDSANRLLLGIPDKATQFAFAYPIGELQGAFPELKQIHPDVAFFSQGGYMYFDAQRKLLCVLSTKKDDGGWLKFEKRLPWNPKWSKDVPPGTFHHATSPELVKDGIKFFTWIPPSDSWFKLDEEPNKSDEEPNKSDSWYKFWKFYRSAPPAEQPKCPHGCFAFLGHHPHVKATRGEQKLDVYYPLEFKQWEQEL